MKKKTELPLCPFPKGQKAGIRCEKLQIVELTTGAIKVCPEPECVYYPEEGRSIRK